MSKWIVRNVAAGVAALCLVGAGDLASAQLFRQRFYPPQPVQPAAQPGQVQPAPAQPVPVQPGQAAPQPPAAAGAAMQEGLQAGQLPPLDPAKIVRGSQFIGQTIVDPRSQRVGVIKDILVDSQTARVVFLLMAQEGPDATADWILIPFDDLRLSVNAGTQPVFILNLETAQLRAAPHMRANAWETLRDPRFIGQVQQFYRPTEWTARRPNGDMNHGQEPSQPGQAPQRREGQTLPAPAPGQPAPGTAAPGRTASPDSGRMQPNEPQNPPKPSLEREPGKSGQSESSGGQTAPDRSKADEEHGATTREPSPANPPNPPAEKASSPKDSSGKAMDDESSSRRLR